jgi:glycosyltransferase involved in cell wall biosynthesis
LNSDRIVSIVQSINPDHIYLNSFFSKKFALLPLWLKKKGKISTNMVLAPRGMLRDSALAFKPFKKSVFLHLFRLAGMHRLVKFQATDEYEKNDILKQFRDAEVGLAPNLPGAARENPETLPKKKGFVRILFVGRIHPVKNLFYLLNTIKDLKGEINFTIIGVNENPAYWAKCSKLIDEMPSNIRVNYLGEQAHERILVEIGQHHIFALPTQGENFGHAIFEALSMGRPVLISDQTPWRNLEKQKAGWDLPLGEPNAFKASLETTLNWEQAAFDEWVNGSLSLAKRFIDQSDMRLNYLKLFN